MTNPEVGVLMLGIFVVTIMLGFPIWITLMAMARVLRLPRDGSRIFDLLTQNIFSVLSNDVLTAVPLFLFMGYVVERANILNRLFYSIQIAAKNDPRIDGRGDAAHLRVLRDRHRHRRRRGDADGPARVSRHAEGRLRHQARGGRRLRGRVPRHHDPAEHPADRLRRDRRTVGRAALRRRIQSRDSCWPASTSSTSSGA